MYQAHMEVRKTMASTENTVINREVRKDWKNYVVSIPRA